MLNNFSLKKYLFLALIVLIPFFEFINSNIQEITTVHIKTLTIIYFIIFTLILIFSLFLHKVFKINYFKLTIFFSLIFYFIFKFRDFINIANNIFEIETSAYVSLITILIFLSITYLFIFRKKNNFLESFVVVYLFLIFIFNTVMVTYSSVKFSSNLKESEKTSNEKFSTTNGDFKLEDKTNIYFIIIDAAISLERFQDIYNVDFKKLKEIRNLKNFQYIPNTNSSYFDTDTTLGSVFNLDYLFKKKMNVDDSKINMFPEILLKKNILGNKPNLMQELEKLGYNFLWVGNNYADCLLINKDLCLLKKTSIKKNYFKNNVSLYVAVNFFSKSPSIIFFNKIFPDYISKIEYEKNDAINIFLKNIEFYKHKKPHFFFIHHFMPHAPYLYDNNCKMAKNKQDNDIGYMLNYQCAIKRVIEFTDYIYEKDKNATVIIQGDHGIIHKDKKTLNDRNNITKYTQYLLDRDKQELIKSHKIFNLIKIRDECKKYISNKIDQINAVRLALACNANKSFEILKDNPKL